MIVPAPNVIDAPYEAGAIEIAVRKCLLDNAFRDQVRTVENPYGSGNVGQKIMDVLLGVELGPTLLRKKMTNRGECRDGWFR